MKVTVSADLQIGEKVLYYPILGRSETRVVTVTHLPFVADSDQIVLFVEEVIGYVAISHIEKLPPNLKNEWLPDRDFTLAWNKSSEKLPEEGVMVLCYNKPSNSHFLCKRVKSNVKGGFDWDKGYIVTHWTTLTKPLEDEEK